MEHIRTVAGSELGGLIRRLILIGMVERYRASLQRLSHFAESAATFLDAAAATTLVCLID